MHIHTHTNTTSAPESYFTPRESSAAYNVIQTNLVEEFSTFLGAAITRNFDFLFGEFIVVGKLFAGEDPSLSEDDDVLETLGPTNDARRAVGIARVVDEAGCWRERSRGRLPRDICSGAFKESKKEYK